MSPRPRLTENRLRLRRTRRASAYSQPACARLHGSSLRVLGRKSFPPPCPRAHTFSLRALGSLAFGCPAVAERRERAARLGRSPRRIGCADAPVRQRWLEIVPDSSSGIDGDGSMQVRTKQQTEVACFRLACFSDCVLWVRVLFSLHTFSIHAFGLRALGLRALGEPDFAELGWARSQHPTASPLIEPTVSARPRGLLPCYGRL